jgi:hypothetical protein
MTFFLSKGIRCMAGDKGQGGEPILVKRIFFTFLKVQHIREIEKL